MRTSCAPFVLLIRKVHRVGSYNIYCQGSETTHNKGVCFRILVDMNNYIDKQYSFQHGGEDDSGAMKFVHSTGFMELLNSKPINSKKLARQPSLALSIKNLKRG